MIRFILGGTAVFAVWYPVLCVVFAAIEVIDAGPNVYAARAMFEDVFWRLLTLDLQMWRLVL